MSQLSASLVFGMGYLDTDSVTGTKPCSISRLPALTSKNLETFLAAWSHNRTGFTLMMLYLIHPDHRSSRVSTNIRDVFPGMEDQQPDLS